MALFNAKAEKEKLERIINNIPEEKKELLSGLITDASFMAEQLEKLREHITKNGVSEKYQNGANQFGKKQTVEADMYVKMIKIYSSVIRQLNEFVNEETDSNGDELLEFLRNGKDI